MSYRLRTVLVVVALLGAPGCGKQSPGSEDSLLEMSEEDLYLRGKDLLERGREADARLYLRRYEQRYPRGPHIEDVKLAIADSFFATDTPEERAEGVALYRQFLTFYPQHPLSCTAQLRIARYYLKQMRSCERDQTDTRQAVEELQKLLASYPDCALADEARADLQKAYDRLACAEYKVAEFYKKTGKLQAAGHRLEDLVRDYPTYSDRCRALGLQVEVLDRLGEPERARQQLEVMDLECAGRPELARAHKRLGVGAPPAPAAPAAGGGS